MLNHFFISLPVGTVLGFLSGLGVGGGSLLILWLTLALGMEHTAARGINLLFFIPSALIAIFFRWKQGSVPFRKIIPAMIAGCIASLAFTWLGTCINTELIRKIFGGLLLVTGVRELFYRPRKAR